MLNLLTSTFCARSDGLKFDLTTTFTSILERPTSRTSGITRNGKLMSFVVRYLKLLYKQIYNRDQENHNFSNFCDHQKH